MTPAERKVLQEAEDQAFVTAQQLYNPLSSGIRPPPIIEETESSIEGQVFGFEFGAQPQSSSTGPGASTPPPEPFVCPDQVTVTFHDVTFCGMCLPVTANGNSYTATDDLNTFNENPIACCTDCSNPEGECLLDQIGDACNSTYEFFHAMYYTGCEDCSCGPPTDGVVNTTIAFGEGFYVNVQFDGTIWRIYAFMSSYDYTLLDLVFYGTTSSLSSTVSNEVECSTDPVDYRIITYPTCSSDSMIPCRGIGTGGTATITIP